MKLRMYEIWGKFLFCIPPQEFTRFRITHADVYKGLTIYPLRASQGKYDIHNINKYIYICMYICIWQPSPKWENRGSPFPLHRKRLKKLRKTTLKLSHYVRIRRDKNPRCRHRVLHKILVLHLRVRISTKEICGRLAAQQYLWHMCIAGLFHPN